MGMVDGHERKYDCYQVTYKWFHKVSRVKFSYFDIAHGQLFSYLIIDNHIQLKQLLEKSLDF